MPRRKLCMGFGALGAVAVTLAGLVAGCGSASQPQAAAAARAFAEKYGWHPVGVPVVSSIAVPIIEPASHDDVSNELLKDADLTSLEPLAGQSVEVYNFRLNDQRDGNLKGLPLHAVAWVRKGQVVGAWIAAQGEPGDPAYAGGFYSIQGRTLEEVTGQDFQAWRQSRLAAENQGPSTDAPANPPAPASPVTWTMSSLDEPWMKAPITVRLTLPQRFRLTFSAAVDRVSVEAALEQDLGTAYTTEAGWKDDQTLDFTVKAGPVTERSTFLRLSAAGGRDRNGLTLQAAEAQRGPAEFQLGIGTASEVWRWTLGDGPRLAAALPGAFDVLSVSPDGSKLVLRLYGIESTGGWPPVGPPSGFAYLYDMSTKRLQRLKDVSGWLSPQWLADGSLLISSTHWRGTTLMLVAPDGTPQALVKNLQVVDYAVSPDGRQVAAFVLDGSDYEATGDLWLISLPSGKRQEFKGAYTPARTPNDVPVVTAVWSPDGTTLAFGDKTGCPVGEGGTYQVVAFDPASGKFPVLLEKGGEPRAWSPDGKYLFVSDTGILDVTQGRVVMPKSPDHYTFFAQFNPRGDRVYVDGLGLLEVPSWQPISKVPRDYKLISWGPDGDLVGLANNFFDGSYTTVGWAICWTDGTDIWSRKRLFPDAFIGPDSRWAWFVWSPDGRFVAVPGVGVGDKTDGQMHPLQSDLGNPIGWNRSDSLFLSPNAEPIDVEYVKLTQFGR